MKKGIVEAAVGVFVLIGLACIVYLTVQLGEVEWLGGDYYHVTARFSSVGGLKDGARVDLAGVQVGTVDGIELDRDDLVAVVRLKIKAEVPLSEDVIASVKTSGLIGDKYIQIAPGGAETLLKDGDRILQTESAVDLEEMIGKYAFGEV